MPPYIQDARLVYKTYATLHILFIFDSSENELAMLDLMQGISTQALAMLAIRHYID